MNYTCDVRIRSNNAASLLTIYIHVALSWVFIGTVSCITTLGFTIATHFYIKKNTIRDSGADLKATANSLAILLAISPFLNLIGLLLISTFSLIIPFNGSLTFLLAYYIPLSLMALSAPPFPLLLIFLLKLVKLALKNVLYIICVDFVAASQSRMPSTQPLDTEHKFHQEGKNHGLMINDTSL